MVVGYDSPWPSTCGMTRGSGDIVYEAISEVLCDCEEDQWQQALNHDELMKVLEAWDDAPKAPSHHGASAYKALTKKYEELGTQLVEVALSVLKNYPEVWRIYDARKQWQMTLRENSRF